MDTDKILIAVKVIVGVIMVVEKVVVVVVGSSFHIKVSINRKF